MEISFKEKVVLITGSSRGIGRAAAIKFAASGAKVAVHCSRNREKAEEVLKNLGGTGHMVACADLADPVEVRKLFEQVTSRMGRIDILVNNAGIFEERKWWDMEYDEWLLHWKKTMDTNLTGAANLSFLVAKQMIAIGGGKIINVSSRGAFRGEPIALPYGSSKAGMNSLGQSMAWALADRNIYVFTLAPGFVATDMTNSILEGGRGKDLKAQSPMNRVASAEEMAHAILLLASDGSEYMSGCILDMNGASYLRS